jgi:hypothetical protein
MKTSTGRWRLVAVIAAMLVATASAQQSATGVVKGTVRRANAPVVSARVLIGSTSDSAYTRTTTTDRDGRFTVTDAPIGGVTVRVYDDTERVIANGRATLQHAGETITLDLQAR